MSACKFQFRAWVHPIDGDPTQIEVWYSDLEETRSDQRYVSEWALEGMYNVDLRDVLKLDPDKHYQIVGRATIEGWIDQHTQEYDESIDIIEYKFAEVPASFFDQPDILTSIDLEAEAVSRDAARYRLLRSFNWADSPLCVVNVPKKAVKLGYDCPSGERLDSILDALLESKPNA